jgi:hypothetical protein
MGEGGHNYQQASIKGGLYIFQLSLAADMAWGPIPQYANLLTGPAVIVEPYCRGIVMQCDYCCGLNWL